MKYLLLMLLSFNVFAANHYLPANKDTVHWGYFSKDLTPVLTINSGDVVTIEALTHHANDAADLMINGDAGAESVYEWTNSYKAVDRRGAGPDSDGNGYGVHILTGAVYVNGAEAGDVLKIDILNVEPRPSAINHKKTYGSNAAANWGLQYAETQREVITIYEIDLAKKAAQAFYSYIWTPQTDPFGVVHSVIDYPGVPVDPNTIVKNYDVLPDINMNLRPHFGTIGLASDSPDGVLVDSIPPSKFGGNIDNWRIGEGSTLYLPVQVEGGLLSVGDPHSSQGDSELCGTAIETSLTGKFKISVMDSDLYFPLLETKDEWVVMGFSYPDYTDTFGWGVPSDVYNNGDLDLAMLDAYHKTSWLMQNMLGLSEDEAISLMTVGVDFSVTQVVDGNKGIHAIIRKCLFTNQKCR